MPQGALVLRFSGENYCTGHKVIVLYKDRYDLALRLFPIKWLSICGRIIDGRTLEPLRGAMVEVTYLEKLYPDTLSLVGESIDSLVIILHPEEE